MVDETLRNELIAMRAEDLRVRAELVAANELGGAYVRFIRIQRAHSMSVR
jgi:hypothetical protein